MNKGNSSLGTFKDAIKFNIDANKADLIILGEANASKNDETIKTDYKGYNVELLFMTGCEKSRIAVLIKEGINYKRLRHLEYNDISQIIIKIKISRGKFLTVACYYRQWHLPSSMITSPDMHGLPGQLDRLARAARSINPP